MRARPIFFACAGAQRGIMPFGLDFFSKFGASNPFLLSVQAAAMDGQISAIRISFVASHGLDSSIPCSSRRRRSRSRVVSADPLTVTRRRR